MPLSNYEIIIQKLDAFISKYYKNLIIKGLLYLLFISLSLFVILAISEYFAHFSAQVRTGLFYFYVFTFLGLFIRFILLPSLALFRLSRHINHQDASKIIGKHFPEISDKLSNILQLKNLENVNHEQRLLIEAGIAQKAENIKPIPILNVIDFKENFKFVKLLFIPIIIVLLTWLIKPSFVEEPTSRLIQFNQEFEKPQAFSIRILNKELAAFQKDDFELNIEVSGDELPEKLFINYQNSRYLMNKMSGNHFQYTFKGLRKTLDFTVSNHQDFKSQVYQLLVYPKASFSGFELEIFPPKYTQMPSRIEKNIGDIKIAEGSILKWIINTNNCDSLLLIKDNKQFHANMNNHSYTFIDTISKTSDYKIYTSNQYLAKSDSISWIVHLIKDEYPQIKVEIVSDSLNDKLLYFNGYIDDDYGFSNLQMIIEEESQKQYENIPISYQSKPQRFYHYLDLNELNIEKGSDLTYYFRVFDNDKWNGYKSAKSKKEFFHFDSQTELIEERNDDSDSLKREMRESLQELKKLHKEISEFKKELVNKELLSWEDKKKMEKLMKEQEKLQKKLDDFKKQSENINDKSKDINQNQRILEKQEQLQELFEQILDEETKKKMEELRKMMEEMNKENSQDLLEQMEMSSQELEDQLDRNMELFKQLEFEIRLEESIEDLNKLAEEQKKLADETKSRDKNDLEDLQQKQDSINKAFEDIKKELNKLDSLNKQLEEQNTFDKKEEEQKKVDSLQQKAEEKLDKKKPEKASEDMKDAADEMQKMADSMQAQMEMDAMEQAGEDMEALREILDQLIKLSFLQEDLMDSLSDLEDIDPSYNLLVRQQFQMEGNLQGVKDSLYSLAKRQAAVKPFIIKEFNKLEFRLKSTTDFLEAHKRNEAVREQQFIMTSLNQLALMLNEAMEQMEQMMQSMMSGKSGKESKGCPKPGQGKPSPKSMKSLQQQLNNQMKALQKQQKEGKQKGKKGQKGQGMSEQFARMAAEQAKIRRMMEEYQQQMLEENGEKAGGLDAMMKDMEKTEHDLVNKLITQQTLNRQQNILTRLLKSEKAEREREKEQKRKSEEGKNTKRSNPKEFFKYKDIKEKELNLMKTLPLDFNNYYKKKVDEYFYKFDNIDDDVEK